jgi:hypothetical protein
MELTAYMPLTLTNDNANLRQLECYIQLIKTTSVAQHPLSDVLVASRILIG